MIIKVTKRKNVSTNQEKSITSKNNTTFRFKSFVDHKDERIRLYNYSRTVVRKRVVSIYVKKDDRDRIKL